MNGKLLTRVIHITAPILLILSGNHQETVQLFVISSPLSPVVLGLPWLEQHNPHIDWSTASIVSWSDYCHAHGLRSAIPAGVPTLQERLT